MQQSPSELKEKLLCALDKDYNVVDMATCIQVVSSLEKLHITKEALEKTRLGKYVNELRKKTSNEQLARRAKDLVKGWRKLIPQTENSLLNGERIAGGITPPGPGPGLGTGRTPGPALPIKSGLVGAVRKPAMRFKPASPAVPCERLASPLSLSASNSPLLQSVTRQNLSTSYAPIKSGHSSVSSGPISPPTSQGLSNVFKPVSPALLAVKQSLTLNKPASPNSDNPVACPKANSPVVANSSKLSPRIPCVSSNAGKLVPKNHQDSYSNYSPTVTPIAASVSPEDDVHSSLDLAKTNPANKRLRKSSDEDNDSTNGHSHPSAKNILVNGLESNCKETDKVKASKWSAFESVRSSSIEENSPEEPTSSADVQIIEEIVPPKPKRGRKRKGPKLDPHDIFKEKLAAAQAGRFHKVKTTQQLIEDLHAKNVVAPGTLAVVSPPSTTEDLSRTDVKPRFLGSTDPEMSKTKSELMDRFLKSTSSNSKLTSVSPTSDVASAVLRTNENPEMILMTARTPAMIDREIETLLRSLPKIDPSVLEEDLEDDDPEQVEMSPQPIGNEELDRLSSGEWNRVNGIYDHENQWHPWQDTAALASQNGELLQILPYVNIDW